MTDREWKIREILERFALCLHAGYYDEDLQTAQIAILALFPKERENKHKDHYFDKWCETCVDKWCETCNESVE